MISPKAFSIRHGINPEPIRVVDDAPIELRYFLFETLQDNYRKYPYAAASLIGRFLSNPSFANKFLNEHDPTLWPRLYEVIKMLPWWQVYDFIEYAVRTHSFLHDAFVHSLNDFLSGQKIAYRMNNEGEILYKGSEAFETAVGQAEAVLAASGRETAKEEIHKALEDLSKRPNPDLTGAVQHAMAALECVANDVCGESGETLGDVIKKHPDQFPQPVGTAVSMLYGFASNNGRHITEGSVPNHKEVELLVGIAATVATYLSR
jgi:hypothetical protein